MRKVIQLRSVIVQHHLILSDDGVDVLDGGFIGGMARIKKGLAEHGKSLSDVRSIILSHGHLDHTRNVAQLKKVTGCAIHAPRADRAHIAGRQRYQGLNRICGGVEFLGRSLLGYQAPEIDHWFEPGDRVHGLEVIGLPGHTMGHCGFLLPEQNLLLAGDLFSCHFKTPKIPPRAINDNHDEAKKSVGEAAAMDLDGIMLNHAGRQSPAELRSRLIDLANHL